MSQGIDNPIPVASVAGVFDGAADLRAAAEGFQLLPWDKIVTITQNLKDMARSIENAVVAWKGT